MHMGVKIVFTRSDGKTFAFDDAPLGVTELNGVDAPKIELFTVKNAVGDGDVITGKRIASRTITIEAKNRYTGLNEQMRKIAAAFFNPMYTYDVEFAYGSFVRTARDCEIKALAIPTANLYTRLQITITLLSKSGYLDGGGIYGKDIASVTPRLGWPWVSVVGVGHLYSLYNFSRIISVNNDGDAPTFIRAVFTAVGTDTVTNPKLIKDGHYIRVLATMNKGDELEIDTENRIIRLNGENALHLVDRESNWTGMRMDVGTNVFGFAADEHDNQLAVRIYYSKRFYGIGG